MIRWRQLRWKQPQAEAIQPQESLLPHHYSTKNRHYETNNWKTCCSSSQGRRRTRLEQGRKEGSRTLRTSNRILLFSNNNSAGSCTADSTHVLIQLLTCLPFQVLLGIMSGAFGLAGFYFGNINPWYLQIAGLN